MAAALMMMGMSSCSNEDVITEVEQVPEKVQLTLTASFDMGGETRAVWDADGITPKFADGDKVGVYSDNSASVEPLDVTVDGDGIATLTGSVTPATTYHLVFPYKAGSTYDSGTKKISGFANLSFDQWGRYPKTALHYAMTNDTEANITFQPLCAMFKGAAGVSNDADKIYIKSAKLKAPVITVDGTGSATVDASVDEPSNPFSSNYMLTSTGPTNIKYYAVAPGSVTLVKGTSSSNTTKTATVVAGKIYNVAP